MDWGRKTAAWVCDIQGFGPSGTTENMTQQDIKSSSTEKWIWPFELLEQIGEGGMGVVYRARYVVNDRHVALKMLPKDVTDETLLARFERELEVLKNLKHPNIVRCFGGSCENSRRFYAMELVEGGSLEDKLAEKKRLPWEDVIHYALQMCSALECSHAQGVVHRDVKPANFLIAANGQIKLSDFGLASVAAARRITAAGKTAGTFLYMAPEQIRGQDVTPRTDLYALGCVLYELVTGDPPFVGQTPAATLHMHCLDPAPRPTEKALDCPITLERIILRLMAKDPHDRPQSATEVARMLKAVKQAVTVVSMNDADALDAPLPVPQATPRASPPTLLDLTTQPANVRQSVFSPWTTVALAIALVVLLTWNVRLHLLVRQIPPSEKLWVQAVDHPQLPVQVAAIESLGEVAGQTGRHVDLLKDRLEHDNATIRLASISAIRDAGAYGKPLTPTLLGLVRTDPDPNVRQAAQSAASKLQSIPEPGGFPWIGTAFLLILFALTGYALFSWKSSTQQDEVAV